MGVNNGGSLNELHETLLNNFLTKYREQAVGGITGSVNLKNDATDVKRKTTQHER